MHQTDGLNMARRAHSLAQTDHAPAEHAHLHRHAADQQSTAICTDRQPHQQITKLCTQTGNPPAEQRLCIQSGSPIAEQRAVRIGRQLISRAQRCAYRLATHQQGKSYAHRQAAHQQTTKLCIQSGSPPAEHKAVHTVRQPTSRGVVRSIVERGDLRVFLQAVKSVLKLASSLLVQGAHWLAEVPVGGRGVQVQARRGVVSQHPGEDWILVQVVECTPGQCVQLHQGKFPTSDLLSWEPFGEVTLFWRVTKEELLFLIYIIL